MKNSKVALAYATMCAIWGTTWLVIKIGLHYAPPLTAVGVRFVVAGAVLAGFAALRGQAVPLRSLSWKLVIVLATCLFGLNYVLTYVAEAGLPSGLTAVLFGTTQFFTFFFRRVMMSARASLRVRVGTVVGFLGLALASLSTGVRGALPYVISIVGAAALAAFGNVYAKRSSYEPLAVLSPAMLLAGSIVSVAGFAIERPNVQALVAPASLFALGYLALIGSALAFFLHSWLMQRIDVSVLNFSTLIFPTIAVALGVTIGHETLSLRELAGIALVLAGTWHALAVPAAPALCLGAARDNEDARARFDAADRARQRLGLV